MQCSARQQRPRRSRCRWMDGRTGEASRRTPTLARTQHHSRVVHNGRKQQRAKLPVQAAPLARSVAAEEEEEEEEEEGRAGLDRRLEAAERRHLFDSCVRGRLRALRIRRRMRRRRRRQR